jgi:hypothetical protein
MRRFLLITVISFAGWSQPAQPQAQPPTVVKVEMPPTNAPPKPLTQFGTLAPGIITSVAALATVWLTSRSENKKWERRTRWTAKRERYEILAREISTLTSLLIMFEAAQRNVNEPKGDEYDKLLAQAGVIAQTGTINLLFASSTVNEAHNRFTSAYNEVIKTILLHCGVDESESAMKSYADAKSELIQIARKDLGY